MSTPNPVPGAGAAGARANMLPPNIFDPRLDGSDYYWYVTNPTNMVAPNSYSSSIQIDSGTDFYWIATTYFADIGGATETSSGLVIPLVTVVIQDSGTSRNLMNAATALGALAGDGRQPYRLVRPRLFRANSVINFTWTPYAPTSITYANLYMTLHGYRKLAQPIGS